MRTLTAAAAVFALLACGSKKEEKPQSTPIDASVKKEPPRSTVNVVKFKTAAEAVQAVLIKRPNIVGFGEFHAIAGGPKVTSALSRFKTDILPNIAGLLSDVIVEVLVEPTGCGKAANQTKTDVKAAMERPAETKDEAKSLLESAREHKLGAHALAASCEDYANLRTDGELDIAKALLFITKSLREITEKILAKKQAGTIAIYGGSLHNDVEPIEGFTEYSYVKKLTAGGASFVEIDMLVPEFVETSKLLADQDWFPVAVREASSEHALLIKRSENSYVVMLKRGVTATSP